jgi:pimeloyl-ACP methyl ester carboxylesterase
MTLFFRKTGQGEPIIICHGLYGMSENWIPIAKVLGENHEVFLPDMRNHGLSPHADSNSYFDLSNDILELIKKNNLKNVILAGHSMGGKACMQLCVENPDIVKKLIVIDISPMGYLNFNSENKSRLNHNNILTFMATFDFSRIKTRNEINNQIFEHFKDEFTQQFLIKNIIKDENLEYRWKINAKFFWQNHSEILKEVDFKNQKITCETLFLKGENSDYIVQEDIDFIKEHFTNVEIKSIKNAGHGIHAENPFALILEMKNFLQK